MIESSQKISIVSSALDYSIFPVAEVAILLRKNE
jgi:hypothetical protein